MIKINQDDLLKFTGIIYDDLDSSKLNMIHNLKTYKIIYTNKPLDLLSFEEYDTEQYWWIIALINNIIDPFNYETKEIKLPNISDLLELSSNIKYPS